MDFTILLTTAGNKTYDISELVSAVSVTDNIDKAGICTFSTAYHSAVIPAEGNAVRIKSGGVTYFAGYIFKLGFSHNRQIKITAYDQLRYLKTNETHTFENLTLTQIVQQLCGEFGLRLGVLEDTAYPLGRRQFDGKDCLDTIFDCKQLTLTKTQKMFYMKDEGGAVVLRSIQSSRSNLLIDPESLIFGYSYERSIDEQTFNQIKLVRDNKATGKRELYITRDSANIKKWGLLQYYEKLDDQVNLEAAKEKANALLFLKNRVQQSLSLDVLGEKSIRAGKMLSISLPDVKLKRWLLCTCAKHTFANTGHTVKVDLRVV